MKRLAILLLSIIFIFVIIYFAINRAFENVNRDEVRDNINIVSLPIIEDNNKYIELQTKEWIKKRENKEMTYGMLEKDKILMIKWILHFAIKGPKIHYYDYHTNFDIKKLQEIVDNNKDKRLIIKISHLQSNYGIIKIEPNTENVEDIYKRCKQLFMTSFVCNHDNSDPPGNKEITLKQKESYYKLYETIEPGIIIQDFFYSYEEGKVRQPLEYKILLFADKIINIQGPGLLYTIGAGIILSNKRMEKVFEQARYISKVLGAHLIRIDFFVKEKDDPYIPYINEISLSPNGGMKKNIFISNSLLNQYREEIKHYNKDGDYEFVNDLLKTDNYRTIPIDKYLSDADSAADKFYF